MTESAKVWQSLLYIGAGGVIALLSSLTTIWVTHRLERGRSVEAKQHQVFCQLMGARNSVYEAAGGFSDASVLARYWEARLRATPWDDKSRRYCEEKADYWLREANEAAVAWRDVRSQLFEVVAAAYLYFEPTKKLEGLAQQVINAPCFSVRKPEGADLRDLDTWKDRTRGELEQLIETQVQSPIDSLIGYLEKELGRS